MVGVVGRRMGGLCIPINILSLEGCSLIALTCAKSYCFDGLAGVECHLTAAEIGDLDGA